MINFAVLNRYSENLNKRIFVLIVLCNGYTFYGYSNKYFSLIWYSINNFKICCNSKMEIDLIKNSNFYTINLSFYFFHLFRSKIILQLNAFRIVFLNKVFWHVLNIYKYLYTYLIELQWLHTGYYMACLWNVETDSNVYIQQFFPLCGKVFNLYLGV